MKNKTHLSRRSFVRNTSLLLGGILSGMSYARTASEKKNILFFLEGGVRRKDMEAALAKTDIAHLLKLQDITCNANTLCHSLANCELFSHIHHNEMSLRDLLKMQGFSQKSEQLFVKENFEIQVFSGFDCAHYNDTRYHDLLQESAEHLAQLIRKGAYDNILCCSEFGRNESKGNHDGYPDGYMHHHEEAARNTFLLLYKQHGAWKEEIKNISYTSEVKQLINNIHGKTVFPAST